jgi:16S rRNA (cytosine967-C5)-methyltransferase
LSARPSRQVARPVANQGQRQAAPGETPGRSPVSSSTSEGSTRRDKSGGALKVNPVADGRISLAQQLVQVTKCVQSVQAGRSLADALPAVPGPLRPGVQALTFHALRHLGTTMALVGVLVERPPAAATRALLGASLALLLPCGGDALVDLAKANVQSPTPDPDGLPAASPLVVDAATHSGSSSVPRYDAFTVVDQAVNAAHSVRNLASQAGLINACLRRFLRESDALLAQVSTDWEAHWNHPAWWVKRVRRDHPQHWQAVLWASNQPAPLTLRVNTTQVSRSDYMQHLQAAGWSAALGEMGDAAITLLRTPQARTGAVDTLPGFADGWFSVQDAAAQVAAPLLLNGLLAQRQGSAASDQSAPPLQGHRLRVLDACAAPGGKTAHLLEFARQQGISLSLQALEVDAQRSLRITENLQRLRLPAQPFGAAEQASEVGVVVANAGDVPGWWDGQLFDAILLDAPCTASGIGRRHPDVRWLRRDTDVAALVATQRTLLDALWPLLAPGGRMVYCTCSVFKAEGHGQIDAFLSRHTDVSAGPSPGHLLPAPPAQGVDMADNAAREHDGFFYARLDKTAL